jgi:hypothetical protein
MIANQIAGLLTGGVTASLTDYESIATVTVGSGGQSAVTFSSISGSYTHLQIRGMTKNTSTVEDSVLSFNGNSIGRRHYLYGTGSATGSGSEANGNGVISASSATANTFSVFVMDILDYANTNKNKTVRALMGSDFNGSGVVVLASWLYSTNTNAITSITITSSSTNFAQYSSFALYGIK